MHPTLHRLALTLLPLALWTAPAQGDTFPGIARPDCPENTQLALNQCAYQWAQATQTLRQEQYDALTATLNLDATEALSQAEATWQAFETTYCAVITEGYREGSIHPLLVYSCRAERNNERIVALTQWMPIPPDTVPPENTAPEPDYGMVLPQLTEAYDMALTNASLRIQAALPSNQELWETYRDQHCAWEVQQNNNSSEQLNRCLTRLTLQRIEQLRIL